MPRVPGRGAGSALRDGVLMPDTYLPCDDCQGLRYGPELSDVTWKGRSIGQVLRITFEVRRPISSASTRSLRRCAGSWRTAAGCYLTLQGRASSTLSGGEAQRLKLVTELAKGLATYRERSRGSVPRNLYILEEPTIGLHLSDCEKLIRVLHALVEQGHTVVVIEHNLDLICEADYVVELGPGGGPEGGRMIYQGALAGLLKSRRSPTAPFLRKKLAASRSAQRRERPPQAESADLIASAT